VTGGGGGGVSLRVKRCDKSTSINLTNISRGAFSTDSVFSQLIILSVFLEKKNLKKLCVGKIFMKLNIGHLIQKQSIYCNHHRKEAYNMDTRFLITTLNPNLDTSEKAIN